VTVTTALVEITPGTTTGAIAAALPAAIPVFQRRWIDFCGVRPVTLGDAVERASAHLDEVLGELLALPRDPFEPDWRTAPIGDLVEHIVSTHHEFTKNAMPALWTLLRQVVAKHGDAQPELHEIARTIAPLFTELGQHLVKEERHLFPYLRGIDAAGGAHRGVPEAALAMMEDEHTHATEAFERLRSLSNGFRAPERASDPYRSLYAGLAELGRDLRIHIHLENNILFVRARESRRA